MALLKGQALATHRHRCNRMLCSVTDEALFQAVTGVRMLDGTELRAPTVL